MKCPLCKAPTDIKETRKTDKGYVRRRECFNQHTFSTVETVLTKPKLKRGKYDRNRESKTGTTTQGARAR